MNKTLLTQLAVTVVAGVISALIVEAIKKRQAQNEKV